MIHCATGLVKRYPKFGHTLPLLYSIVKRHRADRIWRYINLFIIIIIVIIIIIIALMIHTMFLKLIFNQDMFFMNFIKAISYFVLLRSFGIIIIIMVSVKSVPLNMLSKI